uniref:Cytochrome c oxidase subunit 3 n=1 Tax=Magadhaideus sp. n. SX-2018 TaxID=2220057 RepID=A0A451GIR8_9HEMI|nr:cytochrome c oxidase subunit 3 [Magadhaideus sp. n. SX-2018]
MKQNHPYHLVTKSPWPLLTSINVFTLLMGTVMWFHFKETSNMINGTILTILCSYCWWRDISRESTYQGSHTNLVIKGLKLGMMMFIVSEIMFFFSFFWSFFHSSLSPSIEIGMNWPPKQIKPFNPTEIPLLNTIILLSSGVSVTWAHQSILANKFKSLNKSIMMTVIMGIYFTILQKWEYSQSPFTMTDSVYGSTFFITTGFHGIHVIIGTTFLSVCMIKSKKMHLMKWNHLGFEAAAWYWHFVDVVWLFLYISIYWWGK